MLALPPGLQPPDPVSIVDQHAVITCVAIIMDAAKVTDVEHVSSHDRDDLRNHRQLWGIGPPRRTQVTFVQQSESGEALNPFSLDVFPPV
ncbi:MAG TPA: hypothetical protein VKE94_06425, partial [Gemmataceae bacterium]|nr:hypothetical protein [Gemmataceae bacterium]